VNLPVSRTDARAIRNQATRQRMSGTKTMGFIGLSTLTRGPRDNRR